MSECSKTWGLKSKFLHSINKKTWDAEVRERQALDELNKQDSG